MKAQTGRRGVKGARLKMLTPGDEPAIHTLKNCWSSLRCLLKSARWSRSIGKKLMPTHCFVVCAVMNGVLQVKGSRSITTP